MILAVLASDLQKEEIATSPFFSKHEVVYSENHSLWANHSADVFLDLLFEPAPDRINNLAKLLPKPVMVNSVIETLNSIHPSFIRVNAWPGFLRGKYLEAAASEETQALSGPRFGDDLIFVKDCPGFVSPRIVAMVINEAFFTLEAGTASKEEIDIAMKLGTGYPFGPFEWSEKIGRENIKSLLNVLAIDNPVYMPAKSLNL
jgi:3-hydroxybutyryl-CoA dehydrogenase